LNYKINKQHIPLITEGFWILIGQISAVLGSLIGLRILTGLLDPVEFGELALAMTVSALVVQLLTGPISNGITRFYAPAHEADDLASYFKAVKKLIANVDQLIIIVLTFAIVGSYFLGKASLIPILIIAFIFSIISGNNLIINGIQNAARQRTVVALHQGIEPWMRFFFAAGLIYFLGSSSRIALIGYTIGISLVYFSQNVFLSRFRKKQGISNNQKTKTTSEHWRKNIIHFSWPFASWGIFTWAQLVSDRWALEFYTSTKEVGYYAVLFQLGYYPISLASGMAVQLLAPIFYQQTGDATDKQRNRNVQKKSHLLTVIVLLISIAAFIITYFLHHFVFQLFCDIKYHSISYLLPWLILSGGIFAAAQTLTLNIQSQMRTRMLLVPKIFTAIVGIILNLYFASLWGIKGIVIASNIFSIIYFLWMLYISHRLINELKIESKE